MTTTIIIALCSLLLIAYLFDISSSKTRIPAVILLFALGWLVRQGTTYLEINIPDFSPVLPVLGTIGLILIVLEGSLELEFHKSKIPLITRSAIGATIPIILLAFGMAYAFKLAGIGHMHDNLLNALPLCVISSAIAIPTAKSLTTSQREFVTYESSLSDIIGVLLFNFVLANAVVNFAAIGHFVLELIIMAAISFVATKGLAYLLHRINHHIKFVPIILAVILIYAIAKFYHLPSLIFILLFGLFLGNIDELKHYALIKRLHPDELQEEVHKLRELNAEGAFLIRSLFFLLFGFLIDTNELLNLDTLMWSGGIVLAIFILRAIQLKLSGIPMSPLLFIAPRGLITILLFLSIPATQTISLVNNSLLIQIIILTALVMMAGMMGRKR
jgi:hypothetical protein